MVVQLPPSENQSLVKYSTGDYGVYIHVYLFCLVITCASAIVVFRVVLGALDTVFMVFWYLYC